MADVSSTRSSPKNRSSQTSGRSTTARRTNPTHWSELSHIPPSGGLSYKVWRVRWWIESSFALSMLEPWEKLLVLSVFTFLCALLAWSVYYYFPPHIRVIFERAKYYISGDEIVISSGTRKIVEL